MVYTLARRSTTTTTTTTTTTGRLLCYRIVLTFFSRAFVQIKSDGNFQLSSWSLPLHSAGCLSPHSHYQRHSRYCRWVLLSFLLYATAKCCNNSNNICDNYLQMQTALKTNTKLVALQRCCCKEHVSCYVMYTMHIYTHKHLYLHICYTNNNRNGTGHFSMDGNCVAGQDVEKENSQQVAN